MTTYYAIGEQLRLLSEDPKVAVRGSRWRAKVVELVGHSEAALNKCLQFRNEYTEDELPKLERLGVGWDRLTVALAVSDKKMRHRLLRQVRKEGWDTRRLQLAIQQQRGARRGGGRPRRRPKGMGLLADVSELSRPTSSWAEFYKQVWHEGLEGYVVELEEMTPERTESLHKQVVGAVEQLKLLREQADDVLEDLRAVAQQLEGMTGEAKA